MRTTISLDDDVVAAVEEMRAREGIGVSEAVNKLARAGLVNRPAPQPYLHRTSSLGLKLDVSNIGEVLDLLDQA